MIARIRWIPQRRFLITTLLCFAIPVATYAQGYSNPQYHGAQPKKGQAAEIPSYSTPAQRGETPSQHTDTLSPSHSGSGSAMEVGVNLDIPVALGDAGQGLKSKFGGNVALFIQPLLDDAFKNYVSIGYDSFTLVADSDASFRVVPFTFGLELPGQEDKTFSPIFGIALGGAYAWISVPDSQSFSGKTYFLAQVKPGLQIRASGFSIILQTPISYLIGSTKMSFLEYSAGVRFSL